MRGHVLLIPVQNSSRLEQLLAALIECGQEMEDESRYGNPKYYRDAQVLSQGRPDSCHIGKSTRTTTVWHVSEQEVTDWET